VHICCSNPGRVDAYTHTANACVRACLHILRVRVPRMRARLNEIWPDVYFVAQVGAMHHRKLTRAYALRAYVRAYARTCVRACVRACPHTEHTRTARFALDGIARACRCHRCFTGGVAPFPPNFHPYPRHARAADPLLLTTRGINGRTAKEARRAKR